MSRRFKKPKSVSRQNTIDDLVQKLRETIERQVPSSNVGRIKREVAALIADSAVVGYPEFAVQVPQRYPKHCACWPPLYEIANDIRARREAGHRLAVLLASVAAFNAFNATILLALNGLGPDAMVVCRSLLETAMGAVYLATNPRLTDDYVDYAKIVTYKIARRWEAGSRDDLIAATKAEFDAIKYRFPNEGRSWHKLKNDQLASASGFRDLYDDYYPMGSSVSHGDFLAVTARMSPDGYFNPPPAWRFVDLALELAAEITGRMFNSVSAQLGLGCESQVEQVYKLLDEIEPKRREARRAVPKSDSDEDAGRQSTAPSDG